MTVAASERANRKWSARDRVAEFPWPCRFCRRSFRSERGAAQHRRTCSSNPEAPMFTSGAYDPIMRNGRVVGFVWNGRDEHERRRIRASLEGAHEAFGLGPVQIGDSHREVVLGPDPSEPCARCPEARRRHADMHGVCEVNGCPCGAFVGEHSESAVSREPTPLGNDPIGPESPR